ncbi:hypothetical protein ACPA9J_07205 [Pseudomonas aeruginosa]
MLGIPAGVKRSTGVYAISPRAAGELARRSVEGGLVRLAAAKCADSSTKRRWRAGRVAARWYETTAGGGPLHAAREAGRDGVRRSWCVGGPRRRLVCETGRRRALCSTARLHGLARNLGLETTCWGVIVLANGAVTSRCRQEARLFELVRRPIEHRRSPPSRPARTGRGNQQISLAAAPSAWSMRVVATKREAGTLGGRPLLVDSGDLAGRRFLATSGSGLAQKNCCIRWDGEGDQTAPAGA